MSHKPVDIGETKNDEDLPMAGLSIWHVLIFAIVVILLFGTAKLKNLGKDVGGAVKDFKKSIRDEEAEAAQLNEPRTIDAHVKSTESSIKS
jgi:sec-independent protein translocase protein TatA